MKTECEVIRDLLPLYTDEVCSAASRALVEEHIQECPSCAALLVRMKETELESDLGAERDSVIRYALTRFRRRSAAVGSLTSGAVMVPILLCLATNCFRGPSPADWVSIVLAAFVVVASLVAVPLLVPEDKLFWTFCAFCASLMLLLGVICLYTRGDWFWIASSAVLFGLSAIFLPFLLKGGPLRLLLGGSNRALVVLGVDLALFFNMLNMISSRGRLTLDSALFTLCVVVGVAAVAFEIIRSRKRGNGQ